MELTGVGIENQKAFLPLIGNRSITNARVVAGAIEDGKAVGVAMFNDIDEALMLDYIYILPDYRRRGIGTALIEGLIDETRDLGALAMHVNYPENAEDLHGFFRALDFKIFRDGSCYSITAEEYLNSKEIRKLLNGKIKSRIVSIKKLDDRQKRILRSSMEDEDLDPTIIDDWSLSPLLSFVALDKADTPIACILSKVDDTQITILYMINFSHDTGKLLDLLKAYAHIIKERYSDREFHFVTMNDAMVTFAKRLLDDPDKLIDNGKVISGIRMIRGVE